MVDHQAIQGVLAANLRRLRIARHLSLSELGRATGISKATLSSIENGRANPTVDTLAGLAGIPQRGLDELDVDGELRVAEIALAGREARELAAKPVGSRAHLFVLE